MPLLLLLVLLPWGQATAAAALTLSVRSACRRRCLLHLVERRECEFFSGQLPGGDACRQWKGQQVYRLPEWPMWSSRGGLNSCCQSKGGSPTHPGCKGDALAPLQLVLAACRGHTQDIARVAALRAGAARRQRLRLRVRDSAFSTSPSYCSRSSGSGCPSLTGLQGLSGASCCCCCCWVTTWGMIARLSTATEIQCPTLVCLLPHS
jgi:hypothetical protein